MRRASQWLASLAIPTTLLAAACQGPGGDVETTADDVNYRSTVGQEFLFSADVTFTPDDPAKWLAADAQEAIERQANVLRTTVTTAITAKLDELWPEEARTARGSTLAVQFRQRTARFADLKSLDGGAKYGMTVEAEFAGVKDLASKLPMKTEGELSYLPVSVELGQGLVELRVRLTPIERSLNAYPKYLELFEDGLDIGVHFGGDHNDPPTDVIRAHALYDDLVASGFKSPVANFADLKIDSGPLTRTLRVKGKETEVRLRLVHVDMSTPETRELLIDAYKHSVKSADVVVYAGHAGRRLDYSGVVVAYKPERVALAASEFKTLETTDKQQIYLFNGCETYSGYADSLYENPKRKPENTDIITTGNYSAAQSKPNQLLAFLHALVDENDDGWVPRSWDSVLDRMNKAGERSWVHVYGVHGLDDNPKLSPLADAAKVGSACSVDADCASSDSLCLTVGGGRRVCGAACADTAGCPEGTQCLLPKGRTSIDEMQCVSQ